MQVVIDTTAEMDEIFFIIKLPEDQKINRLPEDSFLEFLFELMTILLKK